MSVWRYSAVALAGANQGAVRSGEVSGESAAAARAALREIGLQVLVLRPLAAESGGRRSTRGWWLAHLRTRRRLLRAHLYDGLATLLESGLPLLEALDTTIKSFPRRRSPLRQALVQVRESVRSGELFGQSLLPHASWFDPSEIAMVEAGQHAGDLAGVLRTLSERLERSGELRSRLAAALTYPAIVALTGIAVLVFISTQTLPELVDILRDSGLAIPALTQNVMGLGQALAEYWWVLALSALLSFGAFLGVRSWAHRYRLQWPVWLRRLAPSLGRRLAIAQLSSRLSELLRAGVPLVESLRVVAPTMRGDTLRRSVIAVAARVEHGEELSAAMDDPLYFDAEFRRLLELAQASGDLDILLEKLGRRYERAAQRQIAQLASMLEPLVILALAIAIGLVVMAAVLPLARLQDILR